MTAALGPLIWAGAALQPRRPPPVARVQLVRPSISGRDGRAVPGEQRQTAAGFRGWARSAYNWAGPGQASFVFGLEADGPPAPALKDSQTVVFRRAVAFTGEDKIDGPWKRDPAVPGVAVDAALFYAKGGYAWANNKGVPFSALGPYTRFGQPCPFRIPPSAAASSTMFAPETGSAKGRVHVHPTSTSQTYTLLGIPFRFRYRRIPHHQGWHQLIIFK